MLELERVYFDTFIIYASSIVKDADNIFYMKNKSTKKVEACYLWTGPSFLFGDAALIHNASVVYGISNDPKSIGAKDFLANYELSTTCCNRPSIDYGSRRYDKMILAKQLLEEAAAQNTAM